MMMMMMMMMMVVVVVVLQAAAVPRAANTGSSNVTSCESSVATTDDWVTCYTDHNVTATTTDRWVSHWYDNDNDNGNDNSLCCHTACLQSERRPSRSPVPTSGTVCRRMWPPLHHCRCSDDAWRQFCSTAAIRTYVLSELCFSLSDSGPGSIFYI